MGRGAAVRAGNYIGDDDWPASLAPSLLRMTQLTLLNLSGTLCDIGWGLVLFAGACERRPCKDANAACCGLRRLCAGL